MEHLVFPERRSRIISHESHADAGTLTASGADGEAADLRGPRRTRRSGRGAIVLLCLLSAGVAASIAALSADQTVPDTLATPQEPSAVPLVAEEMQDARSVELQLTQGDELALTSPVDGTLSASSCASGEAIVSGSSTFTVDEAPLLNLHTSTPLWRDLAFGSKGADVDALQAELIRMGQRISATGWFDWATWNAYRGVAEEAGITIRYGELSLQQVLWLPQVETVAATCPVRLGQRVAATEPLAELPTPILAASVKSLPGDLVPGARTLVVGDAQLAVTEDGNLADAAALAALAQTDAYRRYAAVPDSGQLTGELRLIDPITVYPVPPSAVAVGSDGRGCAQSVDGDAVPVRIVGSRLGRAYLAFEGGTETPDAVAARAEAGLTCE